MDFEERVQELIKYVPILEGFINKLSDDPTKESHVQSIRNVKILITERLLTESSVGKCEAVLRKLDLMHKKENQEQILQDRINKLIERYAPFLENCIQKLEKSNSTKDQSHLVTLRKLVSLLNDRRLTMENIDICELSLQQLDEKVEKNTIDRIRARIESDTNTDEITIDNKQDKRSSKKAKIIPFEDNLLFDLTKDDQQFNSLTLTKDPRTKHKSYADKNSKTANKTILLEIIAPYNEDRLALRYKTKKKTSETIQHDHMQSFENLSTKQTQAFDNMSFTFMNATMSYSTVSTTANNVPQMVPPPKAMNNQAYADIVQNLCGEFNAIQPSSNLTIDNSNQSTNYNSMGIGANNLISNLMVPSSKQPIQMSAKRSYGNIDPRLTGNRSQLYDPAAVLDAPQPSHSNDDQTESLRSSNSHNDQYQTRDYDYNNKSRDPRKNRGDHGRRPRTPPTDHHRERSKHRPRSPDNRSSYKRSPDRSHYNDKGRRFNNKDDSYNNRKDYNRYKDHRNQPNSRDETWDDEVAPANKPTIRNNDTIEESWDDECQPIRRNSDISTDTSEKLSEKSSNNSTISQPTPVIESTKSPNFRIPKIGERKPSITNKESPKISKPLEKQNSGSLKQKDFCAELTKLDKPEKLKHKKKENQQQENEMDERKLLEQLSKVYGADKLDKIKSILGEDKKEKTSPGSTDTPKSKKQRKRVRTISTDDENENENMKQKLKEPKIEPPELELQVFSPKKNQKKIKVSSPATASSPQVKKIKKEDDKVLQEPIKKVEKITTTKDSPNKIKKKKTELDKLNEDIDNMFIRDAVLHATGRRNVNTKATTIIMNKSYEEEFYGVKVKRCFVLLKRCDDKPQIQPQAAKKFNQQRNNKNKKRQRSIKKPDSVKNDEIQANTEENLVVNESVRNTDVNYHFQSEMSDNCLLCNFTGKNTIVDHYMTKHSNREVFVSRFNPDIAKSIKDNPIAKNTTICGNVYNVNSKLKLQCGFCQLDFISTRKAWKLHFMHHTGEFQCKSCKVSDPYPTDAKRYRADFPHKPSCSGTKKFTVDDLEFHTNGLDAFMCSECNFVQLCEDNMKKHITDEHENGSNLQPIRFLIIGFDKTTNDNTETTEKMEEKEPLSYSEHCYAQAIPKPLKKAPENENFQSNIPKPLVVKEEPADSASKEPKTSFAVSINHKNKLKVWSAKPSFKTDNAAMNMLKHECLYAFFKCMHPKCAYFTPTQELMESHLHGHLSDAIECCYCETICSSISLYFNHMNEIHKSNIYQCGYCFYRSCAAFNVVTHESHYHREKPQKVLICSGKPSLLVNELEHIYENRVKYVQPLTCTVCFYKTYIQDDFMKHLNQHTVRQIKCQSCTSVVPKNSILQHMLTHRIGLYECVYCFYGTLSLESIRLHMSTVHPTKLLYVTARLKRNANKETMDNTKLEATVLAHIGQNVDKSIISCQETVGSSLKATSDPEALPSPNKGQLKTGQISNLPKISSVVSFGEFPTSLKSLTESNPETQQPNKKLIFQGPTTTKYKPGTKIILTSVGTNQSSAPLKVIKMADGKFVRLNGMPIKSASSTSFTKNIVSTPPSVPVSVEKLSENHTVKPKSLGDLPAANSNITTAEYPLFMSENTSSGIIESIKEEINLGAILMDDDE